MAAMVVRALALLAVLAGTQGKGGLLVGVQLGSKVVHVCVSCRAQCDIGSAAIGATAAHEQQAKHAQQPTGKASSSAATRSGNFGERLASFWFCSGSVLVLGWGEGQARSA